MPAYQDLEHRFKRLSHLSHATSILDWDEATTMPEASAAYRAEAQATLEVLKHEILSDPKTTELISQAHQDKEQLDPWQKSNLQLMQRLVERSTLLPARLVEETTKACGLSQMAWREHRKNNDWSAMLPHLEKIFRLKREAAQIYSNKKNRSPYECLMDLYEADLSEKRVDQLFEELRGFLPSFLEKVLERQSQISIQELGKSFPIEKQEKLGRFFAERLGFQFQIGRLDKSHHPFCGGTPKDVRMTTRYTESEFHSSLFGILHETGHAKYEQNLPEQWMNQPVGRSLGMMVHESQSLFTEMQLCRSRSFASFLVQKAQETFEISDQDPAWSLDNFYRLSTWVKRGFIRVNADEVTYPLHVILRYEIERDIINGKSDVRHIPDMWDAKMNHYLKLNTHGNFKDGPLQDIHWPLGLVGYFPCYTLGALMAAQLFVSMAKQNPEIHDQLALGDFTKANRWLSENIWQNASVMSADSLIEKVTGQALSTQAFKNHLEKRYVQER